MNSWFRILELKNLELNSAKVLEIQIDEREGKYLWCGGELANPLEIQGTCYYAEQQRLLILRSSLFLTRRIFYFLWWIQLDALLDPLAQLSLRQKILRHFLDLRAELDELDLDVAFANAVSDTMYELYLRPVSDEQTVHTKVIAQFDDDPKTLIKNLKAALANPGFQAEYTDKRTELLYFDLRFPNKVYYKFSE
jgi:hypothetical protein